MTRIRLVATDLDGTLLGPSGRISDADAAAVHAAADAGIVIVVATGRPIRWLDCLEPIRAANPLVVVSNGASVYDLHARRVVRSHPLDPALLDTLARDLRRSIPGLRFALEEGTTFRSEHGWGGSVPPIVRGTAAEEAVTVRGAWPELLGGAGEVVKFLAAHEDADADELLAEASGVIAGRAEVTHSVVRGRFALLELSAVGVSKATVLAELCAARGIAAAEVAAFGDMPNDTAMLEFAGRPFVMANGHPALRARFTVIGSNADSGVGAAIRSLLAEHRTRR